MMNLSGAHTTVSATGVPAALFKRGPGDQHGSDVLEVLIFDASSGGRAVNPIATFYKDDMGALDWLEDYLRDARTIALVHNLMDPPEDEDDVEEVYNNEMSTGVAELDWGS